MRKKRIRKISYFTCAAAAALVTLWCFADNLLPVIGKNGTAWAFRAAGVQILEEESAPALCTPVPQENPAVSAAPTAPPATPTASPTAKPEAERLPEISLPAPTPDPARETAPVQPVFMDDGEEIDGFFVKDTSGAGLDLAQEVQIDPDVKVQPDGTPVVLLYSTHTSESYLQYESDWYYRDESFRSSEEETSVAAVAKRAKEVIEAGGFGVIHDTRRFDETYSGSYDRSMRAIQENLEQYPTLQITIDVHRDAFGEEEDGTRYKPVAEIDGEDAAQIMIMAGCDLEEDPLFPDWRENLHLALRLQQKGDALFPGLFRPLFFAQRNYNMHATHGSLLVEVGTEVNTQKEANYAGELLGETILSVLNDLAS